MEEEKTISAVNEDSVWQQVAIELKKSNDPLTYHTVLEQQGRRIIVDIESGVAADGHGETFSNFTSYLYGRNNFRFAIYPERWIDEISKYLGMQDVQIGFTEFDDKFIIKTNDEKLIANLLLDGQIRKTLLDLSNFSLAIVEYKLPDNDGVAPFLELKITEAIADTDRLRIIYNMFYEILIKVDG